MYPALSTPWKITRQNNLPSWERSRRRYMSHYGFSREKLAYGSLLPKHGAEVDATDSNGRIALKETSLWGCLDTPFEKRRSILDDPFTDPIYKENVVHRDAHRREIVRIL
ncbi:hypothetical protein GX48_01080 [Paracoccidioides brasiliensis]|nr:hypothetical protein GX48_01080 [Paracoccidioides brasiliensis]